MKKKDMSKKRCTWLKKYNMENEFRIEILNPQDERNYELELLRHQVFHLKTDERSVSTSHYLFRMKYQLVIPFALFINDELAAGCYISCYKNTLFVAFLFVKEKYQNTGLKIGRLLLSYIMNNKHLLEKYTKDNINITKLTANNDKSRYIYRTLGFDYIDNTPYMCKVL